MKIDNYNNRFFRVPGKTIAIKKLLDHVSGDGNYILMDQREDYVASITEITDRGIKWSCHFLGTYTEGFISFNHIDLASTDG